jgi:hypothetical protein
MNDEKFIWESYINILRESEGFNEEIIEALKDEFSNEGINGEYWDQNGSLVYADGDIGDFNHEAIAIQSALGLIVNEIGMYSDEFGFDDIISYLKEEYDWDSEELKDKFIELCDNSEEDDAVLMVIGDTPENRELLNIAQGVGDARKFAVEKWDWIAIRGNSIEMQNLTRDNLKRLANVLEEVVDIEGFYDKLKSDVVSFLRNNQDEIFEPVKSMDDDALTDFVLNNAITFGISTYTGKSYTVTLNDLEKGNVMGLTQDPNKTKGKLIMHPDLHKDVSSPVDYYKNKPMGDSFNYKGKFNTLLERLKPIK